MFQSNSFCSFFRLASLINIFTDFYTERNAKGYLVKYLGDGISVIKGSSKATFLAKVAKKSFV